MCVLIVPDEMRVSIKAKNQAYSQAFDAYWQRQQLDQQHNINLIEAERESDRTFLQMVKK
ncbi:hypothetical protein [Kangiella sp. TOML190]|uniref:hypothetical protein n=1 Tax=Kangiella sp. TOML190 TaxID=2931351 RepID=UPI00204162EC|nr:hypothetical protein [Kangiella sp. TOML190]